MRRWSHVRPAYDCAIEPCRFDPPCTPRNSHGCHSEEWNYGIIADDGESALQLTVSSGRYLPETRARFGARWDPTWETANGTAFVFHQSWPSSEEAIRVGDAGERDCALLSPRSCHSDCLTCLGARDFWTTHGDPAGFDQPERFWRGLTAEFARRDAARRADKPDLRWKRCPRCEGKGIVRQLQPRRDR